MSFLPPCQVRGIFAPATSISLKKVDYLVPNYRLSRLRTRRREEVLDLDFCESRF